MTSLREFQFNDLFKFNAIVFDPLTEVYKLSFYIRHLLEFPQLSQVSIAPNGQLIGFIFGKLIEKPKTSQIFGHVCSLSVSEKYRRLGLGSTLMKYLTEKAEEMGAWYVNLCMRQSNNAAYQLYRSLGYIKMGLVLKYYPGEKPENAYEMKKIMPAEGNPKLYDQHMDNASLLPSESYA